MYGFGTFTWKDRSEKRNNSLTYQEKLLPRAGTESNRVHASLYMRVLLNWNQW